MATLKLIFNESSNLSTPPMTLKQHSIPNKKTTACYFPWKPGFTYILLVWQKQSSGIQDALSQPPRILHG